MDTMDKTDKMDMTAIDDQRESADAAEQGSVKRSDKKPTYPPKMARTPIGQRKQRARHFNHKLHQFSKKTADAYLEQFSQMIVDETPDLDIFEPFARPALAGKAKDARPHQATRPYIPFKLAEVLPKPGMRYHTCGTGRLRTLLSYRRHDFEIARVLWEDMPDIGERRGVERDRFYKHWVEQLIIPIFVLAKRLIEYGRFPSVFAG